MRLDPQSQTIPIHISILGIIITYSILLVHNLVLLKNILLKNKFVSYTVYLFIFTLSYTILIQIIYHYFTPEEKTPLGSEFIGTLFLILVSSGLYFAHIWIMENVVSTKKYLLNTEMELAQLKQQMNPHFLLNALNNLYGVALASPQNVPDKILELSELLTYQIETSKKEWISLREEMEFAKKYLHYMEWKTNKMKVDIRITGQAQNYRLTPMIFLPLLENAVKYSSEMPVPTIDVEWSFNNNNLRVIVQNNFTCHQRIETTKIGIDNLRRRMALYHPQYELLLYEENNLFTAQLEIWNLSIVA
jgi:sensor histidine kinase YesM